MANMNVRLKFDPGVYMYLIVIDKMLMKYRELIEVRPTEKFFDMVHKQVMRHVIDGKEPPMQIHSAIMNIADDMMAGREVTLRAGDYIALMNYGLENKIIR
ncbi:hypothetical protein ACFL0Q_06415 [Thermodesulfobacteriota bacterium]